MTAFIVFLTLLLLAALEWLSIRRSGKRVAVTAALDQTLAAPGESVTLRCTVANGGLWPQLFAVFMLSLPPGVRVLDAGAGRVRKEVSGSVVTYRLMLLPHTRWSGRLRLTFDRRGVYRLGKYFLEAGDLLGLQGILLRGEPSLRCVCTAELCPDTAEVRALGGLLGDWSVRRFLHEDESMLTGFRDYTGREPMKAISWIQTARTGTLTVKQYDHTAEPDAMVLVGLRSASPEEAERCLSLARTVCEMLEERAIAYSFASDGDLRSFGKGFGKQHLLPILRTIGEAKPVSFTGLYSLCERCSAQREGSRGYIVITTGSDPEEAAALALLRSRSEHEICVLYGGRRDHGSACGA